MALISSPTGDSNVVRGSQRPRICNVPDYVSSAGDEAIDLAAMCGLHLDDWQQFVLRHSLGERPDGKWSAQTVGLVVGRQNGKNAVLEARELAGIFLLNEQLIIHTAHEQKTATEHFRRVWNLIKDVPEFRARVLKPNNGKGSEAIEFRTGQRIFFSTRTGGGGRGLTADLLVYDEAMHLSEAERSALTPTLAALSMHGNTQIWYTGSAVDQENPKHNGVPLAQVRESGIASNSRVAYFEWSAPGDDPDSVSVETASDPDVQALANPGLGTRISLEWVEHERTVELGRRGFAVERLGIGDWPDASEDAGRVISRARWLSAGEHDMANRIEGVPTFAIDGNMDETWASLAVAGTRADERLQGAIVRHDRGTDWLVDACVELRAQHRRAKVVVDKRGPVAHLIPALIAAKVRLIEASTEDYGNACSDFVAGVVNDRFRYPAPQPELDDALANARKAPLGDRWKWSRKDSASSDISPIVAVTLAVWGHSTKPARARVINLNDL